VGFFLTASPTSVPTSVFPFFPILIFEENVCNTLGLVRVDLLGSLELVRGDLCKGYRINRYCPSASASWFVGCLLVSTNRIWIQRIALTLSQAQIQKFGFMRQKLWKSSKFDFLILLNKNTKIDFLILRNSKITIWYFYWIVLIDLIAKIS